MAKFCSSCGKEVNENAIICVNCGVKLDEKKSTKNIDPNAKSRIAAGLFGIFLGCFGVHNFYLGYTGKAVAQLLITLLSLFILSPVSAIWGLIEGIIILATPDYKDANGNALKD